MKEHLTTVTRKGQITLPAAIRRHLGLKEGDKVAVALSDAQKGHVKLRPVRSVAEMTYGSVAPQKRPEDLDALRRQFAEETARRALARSRSS